jgi:hypothetical protein
MSTTRTSRSLAIALVLLWFLSYSGISSAGRKTQSAKEPVTDDLKSPKHFSDECGVFAPSRVEGLRIEMLPQPCVFTLEQARQGITFRYEVVIERDIAGFETGPQDEGCCLQPGLSTLYAFPEISGGGQRYAGLDWGNCDCAHRGRVKLVRLKKGRYPEAFSWNGANWSGPSDTNRPQGVAFPPGTYKFEVKIRHFRDKQPAEYVVGGMLVKIVEN